MAFNLSGLSVLHKDMISKNETRSVFPFEIKNRGFSCIFITDTSPYYLLICALGKEPFSMEFEVDKYYNTNPFLGNNYSLLLGYLQLDGATTHQYLPKGFFYDFNLKIPLSFQRSPNYRDVLLIARKHRDIDEADKIYFCGWHTNPKGKYVTPANYDKTKFAFGDEVAERSKRSNISSKWTNEVAKENLIELNHLL